MNSLTRLRSTTVLTVVASVVLAIGAAITLANYVVWATQSKRFNSTYESGQLSAELFRFEATLANRFLPGSQTTQDEIELRYQILLNRLTVIEGGETYQAYRQVPQGADEYADIKTAIHAVEARLPQLGDPAVAREVLDTLLPLNSRLLRLASTAQNVLTTRVSESQEVLGKVVFTISIIVAVLVLSGVALVITILRLKQRSDRDARYDSLTGVLNRNGFNIALAELPRGNGPCAIVLLDVDNFKAINDRYGHGAGDAFLVQITQRVSTLMQPSMVLARLGGDEFAIVFCDKTPCAVAEKLCQDVANLLRQPFDVGEAHFNASASMGVALETPGQHESPITLMKNADGALYAAKEAGRACYRFFDPVMREQMLRRHELRQGLFVAQERSEFHLRFQPIVELEDGGTRGFEVLLRWTHPTLGDVPPGEFIPVAESSAQIIAIGRWVIAQGLRVAATWPDDLFISINLSARQFTDVSLVDYVERTLAASNVRPQRVVFEITESVLVHNEAADIIARLRRLGVQVALDDFGTGYAALSYLRRFELDKIKIDKSFIQTHDNDPRNTSWCAPSATWPTSSTSKSSPKASRRPNTSLSSNR